MELDREKLERIRDWAQARIEAHERRKNMAPLYEAMQKSMQATMNQVVPKFMAEPVARVRRSVLAMEKNLAEAPSKLIEAELEYQQALAKMQARTRALRHWLEALP